MVLLLSKLYLYFTKDPEGAHYFPGVGCQTFSRGVQMLISLETHIRNCYFPGGGGGGGGCPAPYPPLESHMGNIIITGQYLSQSRF